jgi:predicted transcriptional regulator
MTEPAHDRSIAPLVRFDFITLDPEETVAQARAHILSAPPQAIYPVVADGALLGVLDPAYVRAIGPEYWATTKVHWLVRRSRQVPLLDLDTDALHALAEIDAARLEGLPVRDEHDHVIALIERSAIKEGVA